MNTLLTPAISEAVSARNTIAAALTIVPGLGHLFKGHVAAGLLWMLVGMPMAIWVGLLLSLATAGVGLLFPLLCWTGLAVDAYYEKDRRHHHSPPAVDELLAVEQD